MIPSDSTTVYFVGLLQNTKNQQKILHGVTKIVCKVFSCTVVVYISTTITSNHKFQGQWHPNTEIGW